MRRQALNVFRMQLLGAEVVPVTTGSRTLKDAINEAIRDWVATVRTTRTTSSARSSGRTRSRRWCATSSASSATRRGRSSLDADGRRRPTSWPPASAAGRNAIGMFTRSSARRRRLIGVEAGGRGRRARRALRARSPAGSPGVLHGALQLPAAGRRRPGADDALDLRRARLPGRRARSTRTCKDAGLRRVHVSADRRRGARGVPGAGPDRGHPARARAGARDRVAAAPAAARGDARSLVCLSGRGDKDLETVRGERSSGTRRGSSSRPTRSARRASRRQGVRPVRDRRAGRASTPALLPGARGGRRRRDRGRDPVLGPGDGRPRDPGGVRRGRSRPGARRPTSSRRIARGGASTSRSPS